MVHVAVVVIPPLMELLYGGIALQEGYGQMINVGIFYDRTNAYIYVGVVLLIHTIVLCNAIYLICSHRLKPYFPRPPTTLANQILYLCHSEALLSQFEGTSTLETLKEVEQHLGTRQPAQGQLAFGWFSNGPSGWVLGAECRTSVTVYPFVWQEQQGRL